MLQVDCIYRAISVKLKGECKTRDDLVKLEEVKRTIMFFRFTKEEIKVILDDMIKKGYIKREGKENIKLVRISV